MDQLVTSLLDYVRLKADTLEIVSRPFDAAELLREAVDIFGPLARARSLSLVLAVPAGPLLATADPDRLFQVISNILANAIKFSSPEGRDYGARGEVGRRPAGRHRGRRPRNSRTRPGSCVRGLLPASRSGCARARPRALHRESDRPGARREDLGDEPAGSWQHVPFRGAREAFAATVRASARFRAPRRPGLIRGSGRVSAQSAGRRRNLRSSVAGSQLERIKRLDAAPPPRPMMMVRRCTLGQLRRSEPAGPELHRQAWMVTP